MIARRVLIVDEREPSRVHIAHALRARGLETCEAVDGWDGLDAFDEREASDAVVTDMRTPHSDGFDLLERIRTNLDLPMFCVSAYPEWETALRAAREGATCLPKAGRLRLPDRPGCTGCAADAALADATAFDSLEALREEGRLETVEERRAILESALRATRGNVAQATEVLRVSTRTLHHWIGCYGVRREDR